MEFIIGLPNVYKTGESRFVFTSFLHYKENMFTAKFDLPVS